MEVEVLSLYVISLQSIPANKTEQTKEAVRT